MPQQRRLPMEVRTHLVSSCNVAMWLNVFMTWREYAIYCTYDKYAEPRLTCVTSPSNQINTAPLETASTLKSGADKRTGLWNTCSSFPSEDFPPADTHGLLARCWVLESLSLQIAAEKKNSGPFWSSESSRQTGSDWPFLPIRWCLRKVQEDEEGLKRLD